MYQSNNAVYLELNQCDTSHSFNKNKLSVTFIHRHSLGLVSIWSSPVWHRHSCRGKPSPSLAAPFCWSVKPVSGKRVLIDVFSPVVLWHLCSSSPTHQANPGVGRGECAGRSQHDIALPFISSGQGSCEPDLFFCGQFCRFFGMSVPLSFLRLFHLCFPWCGDVHLLSHSTGVLLRFSYLHMATLIRIQITLAWQCWWDI